MFSIFENAKHASLKTILVSLFDDFGGTCCKRVWSYPYSKLVQLEYNYWTLVVPYLSGIR